MCFISREPGRPQAEIDLEQVEYLRSLHFSTTKIAHIIGISRSTLYRRLEAEGIDITRRYSALSDADIDRIMQGIKQDHPNDGERLVIGHLHRMGIHLPRSRIRASIHRVDPINTALRRSVTVRRRVYHAEGPNAIWHIDGHHKMIKWRFVTHGGIDGFSRTIVYLRCSTNNRASTVLSSFLDAVGKYGLPTKVRSDLGGENIRVWEYLIDEHGSSNAVVVGSSTHNERIERLWRDVQRCVSVLFADLFRCMEENSILSCLNEVDLFCLHQTFLPRINSALDKFVESWNNHPMSTANNLTPNQQFIQGALAQNMAANVSPTTPVIPGAHAIPSAHDPVSVPRSSFEPCRTLIQLLDRVNYLQDADDFGYSLYEQVCHMVGTHTQSCSTCDVL